jgi:hypothetical protein
MTRREELIKLIGVVARTEAGAEVWGDRDSTAFLEALSAAGFVIAPKEPSEKMISAALENGFEGSEGDVKSDYRAMLSTLEEE